MTERKIVRRKIIVRGEGIRNVIMEYSNNGIKYLRKQSVKGVQRLVPYAFEAFKKMNDKSIEPAATKLMIRNDEAATHGMDEFAKSKLIEKNGGNIKPNRSLIMREMNHALRSHK